jgi:hypothetical protein
MATDVPPVGDNRLIYGCINSGVVNLTRGLSAPVALCLLPDINSRNCLFDQLEMLENLVLVKARGRLTSPLITSS